MTWEFLAGIANTAQANSYCRGLCRNNSLGGSMPVSRRSCESLRGRFRDSTRQSWPRDVAAAER